MSRITCALSIFTVTESCNVLTLNIAFVLTIWKIVVSPSFVAVILKHLFKKETRKRKDLTLLSYNVI